MSIYDHMEFPPYVFREYPKMIDNDTRDPVTGHGTGKQVWSKAEEEAYWASKGVVASEDDEGKRDD